jgi:acyl transferase domain-containing protein
MKALEARGVGVRLEVGERTEWSQVLEALGALYVKGVGVDWAAYEAPYGRRRVPLPTYPFQRQRHWWSRGGAPRTAALSSRQEADIKPHLGRRLRSPALQGLVYETTFSASRPAYLDDHRLYGTVVTPAASHLAMLLSAIEDAYGSPACTLENLAFPRALVLADGEERPLQLILTPREQGSSFEVMSLGEARGSEAWVLHATGELRVGAGTLELQQPPQREEFLARCVEHRLGADLYRSMNHQGYTLGSSFRWIGSIARIDGELLGRMEVPSLRDRVEDYVLYPGLIDSCFQVLAGGMLADAHLSDALLIPFSISRFRFHRRPQGKLWCYARATPGERAMADESLSGDLQLCDEQGVVAEVIGLRARLASRELLRRSTHAAQQGALYEVTWQPEPTPQPVRVPAADGRPWLVLTDGQGVGERLGSLLEAQGAPVIRARPGAAFRALGAGAFELDARRPEDFARLLGEAAGPRGLAGVVYLWGLERPVAEGASAQEVQQASLEACGGALHLVQALVGRGGQAPAPLWLVTHGAQAVGEGRAPLSVAQAALWGLGRVVELEHAELRCTRVDLDPADVEGSVRLLHAELGREGSSPVREVAFRGSARLCPVLRRDTGPRGTLVPMRADGTYLITGGLGGLGLEVARWMVERGARHLVLVGRRAPSAAAAEVLQTLERAGASVRVASVDISREDEVARLLKELEGTSPPLRGVVHAAGVLEDGALLQQDLGRLERVMAPKVAGAWSLHRLTADKPLELFLLFSSASATLGSPGQGGYAAANAFLDALAQERRARGLAAQALDWGPWAETGMVGGGEGRVARLLEQRGLQPFSTRQALALFGEAIARGRPQVALLAVQWPVYLERLGPLGRSPLYAAVAPARANEPHGAAAVVQPQHPLAERLKAALPHERSQLLTRFLQEEVARVLRLNLATGIDWRQGFAELGMDSLMAIELRNALQKGLGKTIPATVALDHPTIDFLVKHLLSDVLKLEAQEAPPAPERKPGKPKEVSEQELDALSDAELARLVAEDLSKEP